MKIPDYPDLATIDGQAITIPTLDAGVVAAITLAKAGRGFRFFTLNLDHIVKLRHDPAFRKAYAGAELVSADGAPVAVLARRQAPGIKRTTGADLVRPLCKTAAELGIPVAFFGSSSETLERSAAMLEAEFPGLKIVHREAPPFGFVPTSDAATEAARRLAKSGARIVFVALGAPKQEFFAAHAAIHAPDLGMICIGAALDFVAGTQTRAPALLQNSGFEWLWRLGTNPAGSQALCALRRGSRVPHRQKPGRRRKAGRMTRAGKSTRPLLVVLRPLIRAATRSAASRRISVIPAQSPV